MHNFKIYFRITNKYNFLIILKVCRKTCGIDFTEHNMLLSFIPVMKQSTEVDLQFMSCGTF
jgi:hypothetical protein